MKKFLSILIITFVCLLVGCKTVVTDNTTPHNNTTSGSTTSTAPVTSTNTNDSDVEFVVKITMPNGDDYYEENSKIEVIWTNSSTEKRVKIDENGIARTKGLVGKFNVHLSSTPSNYTYDPNATVVDNENPEGIIKLMRILKITEKNNNDIYNPMVINNITISSTTKPYTSYCYIATLKEITDIKYYQFNIKNEGTYVIESMVDIYANNINPIVRKYFVGDAAFAQFEREIDDGGTALSGGYTKNFKFQIDLDKRYIGAICKFGIKADRKDEVTGTIQIPFKITYIDTYEEERASKTTVYGNEIYYKRDDVGNIMLDSNGKPVMNYVKIESDNDMYYAPVYTCQSDGNLLHYPYEFNSVINPNDTNTTATQYLRKRYKLENGQYVEDINGEYILKETTKKMTGSNYQDFGNYNEFDNGSNLVLDVVQNGQEVIYYNEADGYYHYNYNGEDRIVCAKITVSTVFVDLALTHIEDPGNGSLHSVVINRKIYNYKRFLEAEYASLCNEDGVCYVTKELKEFLQAYSNSGSYFFDGNGVCELDGVFASEENQWLYACGFYKEI